MKTLKELRDSAIKSLEKYEEMDKILVNKEMSDKMEASDWLKLYERANKTAGAIKRTYKLFVTRYFEEHSNDEDLKDFYKLFSVEDAIRNYLYSNARYFDFPHEYINDMMKFSL